MSKDHVTTYPSNTPSPTTAVARNGATGSYSKSPLLDERTVAILVAIATPNKVSADLGVGSGGKRGGRKRRKNRKNSNKLTGTKSTLARTGNRVGKSKKNSATATTTPGSSSKSPAGFGKQFRLKKAQKREKSRRRSEKENAERKKWLESWFDSENKRKGKQAVDGLVGLLEGFGFCAGAEVQVKGMVEGEQEGIVMDMDGLERQMATLEVMREDGKGGL